MAREYRLRPTVVIPDGVTLDLPGIYEWVITYVDGSIRRYVGMYGRRSRPNPRVPRQRRTHPRRAPYRGATPCGFWQVHKELAEATKDGRLIVLTILENTAPEDLNYRE